MYYTAQARLIPTAAAEFYRKLTDGTVERQKPDGKEIVASMGRAKIDSAGVVRWSEVCYCPTPLEHERKTVYDRHFTELETEEVEGYVEYEGRSLMEYLATKDDQANDGDSEVRFCDSRQVRINLMNDVVVRPLEPVDSVKEITELLHLAYRSLAEIGFRYHATHQDESVTRKRMDRGRCFVATIDSEIIATITFYPPDKTSGSPWYDRPDIASFEQFAVHPDYQRLGIGSALIDTCEDRARQIGAVEMAIDTAEGATHLIDMYKKRGYRFIEYGDWDITNYRSVILSKPLTE
jgi:GNAT superfamily N-acetyltransferase